MSRNSRFTLLFFLLMPLVFSACSSLKHTRIGKWYHNTTARYNGYFNAKEMMIYAEEDIRMTHEDNFADILPVYRLGDEAKHKQLIPEMDIIDEKCTKVIQKHDISKWVDNCYLLIGKAFFYKGEYFAAIETFEYLNNKYKNELTGQEALLWLVFSNLYIDRVQKAYSIISLIESKKEGFPEELRKELLLTKAHLYIEDRNYSEAIPNLKEAIELEKKRPFKNRYIFILGQLYQATEQPDKASEYYKIIANRNLPYEMAFKTQINLAACTDLNVPGNKKTVTKNLKKMLRDDKNIEYFDQIYYELAMIEFEIDNIDKTLRYLYLSNDANVGNQIQLVKNHLFLAEYFFENADYYIAQAHYDSADFALDKNHPNYEEISKTKKVLDDLVSNLTKMQEQDSLLNLALMDRDELDSLIEEVYQEDKRKEEELARLKEEEEFRKEFEREDDMGMRRSGDGEGDDMFASSIGGDGEWYFYNPANLGSGYASFVNKWGKRQLEDNWRLESKSARGSDEEEEGEEEEEDFSMEAELEIAEMLDSIDEDKQKYYRFIPFTDGQQKAANTQILKSYFNIGNIYYKDLHELEEAVYYYEALLERYPDNPHVIETNYYLFKIYKELGNKEKQDYYKNFVLENYPETKFALLIDNPMALQESKKNKMNPELERLYGRTYEKYRKGNCEAVSEGYTAADSLFEDNYLYAKFEYLEMLCRGRALSHNDFKEEVKSFIQQYSSESVASHAQAVLNFLLNKEKAGERAKLDSIISNSPYNIDEEHGHFYLLVFDQKGADVNKIQNAFSDYNNTYFKKKGLSVNMVMVSKEQQALVVKDFDNLNDALKYDDGVEKDKTFIEKLELENYSHFPISKPNFSILMEEKNLEQYLLIFDLLKKDI